jgi:hypothetical protein
MYQPPRWHPARCCRSSCVTHAIEQYARVRELEIVSDDPDTPVRLIEVLAHTVREQQCGCEARRRCCEPKPCCCDDDGERHHG